MDESKFSKRSRYQDKAQDNLVAKKRKTPAEGIHRKTANLDLEQHGDLDSPPKPYWAKPKDERKALEDDRVEDDRGLALGGRSVDINSPDPLDRILKVNLARESACSMGPSNLRLANEDPEMGEELEAPNLSPTFETPCNPNAPEEGPGKVHSATKELKHPRQRRGGRPITMTKEDIADGGRRHIESLLNVEVESNRRLRNYQKALKIKLLYALKRKVGPTQIPLLNRAFSLETSAPQPGRNFLPKRLPAALPLVKGQTAFCVQNAPGCTAIDRQIGTEVFWIPNCLFHPSQASTLHEKLCRGLERAPGSISRYSAVRRSLLALVAIIALDELRYTSPEAFKVPLPFVYAAGHVGNAAGCISSEDDRYAVLVHFFTPECEVESKEFKLRPATVNLSIAAPPIPDGCMCQVPDIDSNLDPIEQQLRLRAIEHLRYASWKVSGTMATVAGLKAWWADYMTRCCKPQPGAGGFGDYDGSLAFGVAREFPNVTRIRIPTRPRKDLAEILEDGTLSVAEIDEPLPDLRVDSIARIWTSKVLAVWHTTWERETDYLEGFLAAAEAADCVNVLIELDGTTSTVCDCDPDARKFTFHLCDFCSRVNICGELEFDSLLGLRICLHCRSRKSLSKNRCRTIVKQGIRNGVNTDTRIRGKAPGVPFETDEVLAAAAKERCNEIFYAIESDLDFRGWDQFPDKYVSGAIRPVQRSSRSSSHSNPLAASFDAIQPIYRNKDGRTDLHCEGNVCFTARYLNLGIGASPKGALQVLSRYINGCISKKTFNRVMADFQDLLHSIPYKREQRLGQSMTEPEFAKIDQNFRMLSTAAGRSKSQERELKRYLKVPHISKQPQVGWKPHDVERIEKLIDDIIFKARTKRGAPISLSRSQDGCPYPFDEDYMPLNWSWELAWWYFGHQFRWMWLVANGSWRQLDDTANLFVEAIRVRCDRDITDEDPNRLFPALPIVPWLRTPITLSLGHTRPGIALMTGWPLDAESVDRWSAENCTLIFETKFENGAKWKFHPNWYGTIRADFQKVALRPEQFDPSCLQDHDAAI